MSASIGGTATAGETESSGGTESSGQIAEAVVDVRDLRKKYAGGLLLNRRGGVEALRGVSLTVSAGEVFGLLGPNGAGKTTLIKTLLGVVKPSGGAALLFNHPVRSSAARWRVGYLPETLRVDRHHTARSALRYYGRLSHMDSSSIDRRSDELLELVGLSRRDRESVRQFSKGMYQRLGLAQALMHDPDLLVLDEPTDGLDPVGRNDVRKVIDRLRGLGKTIFLNSHILQEVELVCTRVAIMAKGKILASGSIDSHSIGAQSAGAQSTGTQSTAGGPLHRPLLDQRDQHVSVTLDLRTTDPDVSLAACFQHVPNASTSVQTLASPPATHRVVLTPAEASNLAQSDLDATVDRLRSAGVSIVRLQRHVPTLEDTFIRLVQSAESPSDVTSTQDARDQDARDQDAGDQDARDQDAGDQDAGEASAAKDAGVHS